MTVIVRWETTKYGNRGPSRYVQRKTFRGLDARGDAERYRDHVVMGQDPEWVVIEPIEGVGT